MRNTVRTPEGWLRGEVECARVGVYPYPQPDGSVRWEYTPAEELFSPETLASLSLLPVTNGHPEIALLPDGSVDPLRNGLVNADNADRLSVGSTGTEPIRDGEALRVPFAVHDRNAVFDVENGRNEVSMGYTYVLEPAPPGATWNGKPYTHVKRKIIFNHMALVDVARIGPTARINLDGFIVHVGIDGYVQPVNLTTEKGSRTMKIKLKNGIEYEAPAEVVAEIEALNRQVAADGATYDAELKKVIAERDDLKKQLEAAQATIAGHDGALKKAREEAVAAVHARAALTKSAAMFLSKDVLTALDEAPDVDVMKAALKEGRPKFVQDGKTDEEIKAAYDAMVEAKEETTGDEETEEGKEKVAGDGDVTARQRAQVNGGGGNRYTATDSYEDPREAMLARHRNAYKTVGAK